jgi:hypothetical protein
MGPPQVDTQVTAKQTTTAVTQVTAKQGQLHHRDSEHTHACHKESRAKAAYSEIAHTPTLQTLETTTTTNNAEHKGPETWQQTTAKLSGDKHYHTNNSKYLRAEPSLTSC